MIIVENNQLLFSEVLHQVKAGNIPIIAIAGPTCAGKTYTAKLVSDYLSNNLINNVVIRLDDYFKDFNNPTIPRNDRNRPIFDLPDSYHLNECREDIKLILQGRPINIPNYDLNNNKRLSKDIHINPSEVVIIEGVYAIMTISHIPKALHIYINTSVEKRIERRTERDVGLYGVSKDMVHNFFYGNILPYEYMAEKQKLSAQIIIED